MILLTVCVTASADWVRVGDTLELKFEKYIDPDHVRQSGPMAIMRQVWEISNYLEPTKDRVASVKTLSEYDCQNRQLRVLKEFWFAEPWAKGRELTPAEMNQAMSQWTPITSNSVGEAIINMVCPGSEDG
jgi:hypothetical protein